MQDIEKMIPDPVVVRERLARNLEEGRMLRSLLRLSVRAVRSLPNAPSSAGHGIEPRSARPGSLS
jgi:hypothetical protein